LWRAADRQRSVKRVTIKSKIFIACALLASAPLLALLWQAPRDWIVCKWHLSGLAECDPFGCNVGAHVMFLMFGDPSRLSDGQMHRVGRLIYMRELSLNDTAITDDGLSHLSGMQSLQKLWLHHTGISDAGLSHLKPLQSLRHLDLSQTRISDDGLAELECLKSLESLVVIDTAVTEDGVSCFQKAVPECRIKRARDEAEAARDTPEITEPHDAMDSRSSSCVMASP
jgi:hypothetical protein